MKSESLKEIQRLSVIYTGQIEDEAKQMKLIEEPR